MPTNVIDAFFVTVGLDSSSFKASANEVGDISKKTGERTKKAFSGMEEQGKGLGQAFRTVRNEAIGLFLAMTGASSITNFITGMLTSTATADRFGQTVGMATGRVVAWRQAMKVIGGHPGSADAGLGIIEKAMQSFRLTGTTGIDADLIGLGVNRSDLMNKDPGQILEQISQARGRMTGPEFGERLQRIGMPQEMIYFLQQGGDQVKKLISSYEKNAKQYEDQAKAAENLQKTLAELTATITNKLVPPITRIAEFLNDILGDVGKPPPPKAQRKHAWGIPGLFEIESYGDDGGSKGASGGHWWDSIFQLKKKASPRAKPSASAATTGDQVYASLVKAGFKPEVVLGIVAGVMAEGGEPNADNPTSHAFGIGQWLGDRKKRLFDRYHGKPTIDQQIEFLIWELLGGDPKKGGSAVLSSGSSEAALDAYIRKFMRPKKGYETVSDLSRGMSNLPYLRARHGHTVNIGHITVETKATDAHGVARGIHHALKKRGIVARADGGVAP